MWLKWKLILNFIIKLIYFVIKELYDLYNTAFGKKSSKPADLCHCSKTDNLEIASKDARPEQRQVTKRDSTPQKGFRTNS